MNDIFFVCVNCLGSHVRTSLRYLQYILSHFSELIISTRSTSNNSSSVVNLAREERLTKCNNIYNSCKSLYPNISTLPTNDARISNSVKQVRTLIEQLMQPYNK